MEIKKLDLTVRTYGCLKRAGVNTLEDLTNKTEEEAKQIRNIGKRSIEELKQVLEKLNLRFRNQKPKVYDWYKVKQEDSFYDDMTGRFVEEHDKTIILEFRFSEKLGGVQRVAFYKNQLVYDGNY